MDVFGLQARLGIDTSSFSNGLSKAKDAAQTFAKVGAAAFTAVATAAGAAGTAIVKGVSSLVKQSVSAYGEYQQLVGGINKLYGESGKELQEYANQAYLTAGMSANAYMQNVTGFSAALINSLSGDTSKAVKLANEAMQDISDNANTFGKYTVEELAQVYQALAKGNYQTLDNLMLGFAGTKEGMKDLLAKATEIAEKNGLLTEADYKYVESEKAQEKVNKKLIPKHKSLIITLYKNMEQIVRRLKKLQFRLNRQIRNCKKQQKKLLRLNKIWQMQKRRKNRV